MFGTRSFPFFHTPFFALSTHQRDVGKSCLQPPYLLQLLQMLDQASFLIR